MRILYKLRSWQTNILKKYIDKTYKLMIKIKDTQLLIKQLAFKKIKLFSLIKHYYIKFLYYLFAFLIRLFYPK